MTGPAESLAAITDLSASVGGWLREYNGYRGVFVLADPEGQTSRVMTLWDSAEDDRAARESRGAMRDQLMAMVDLRVVAFDVYDVPGHEYVPE